MDLGARWLLLWFVVIFIVDTIVELSVVVVHVLPIDFTALISELQCRLGHQKLLNTVFKEKVIRNVALSRVEWS